MFDFFICFYYDKDTNYKCCRHCKTSGMQQCCGHSKPLQIEMVFAVNSFYLLETILFYPFFILIRDC